MLVFDVTPGIRLGPFFIGMPLRQTIHVIKEKKRHTSIKFSEEIKESDIVLELAEDGILLRHDPILQQLQTIEVYDISKIMLRYKQKDLLGNSKSEEPCLSQIQAIVGPSQPGTVIERTRKYIVDYRQGISFVFNIPNEIDMKEVSKKDISYKISEALRLCRILITSPPDSKPLNDNNSKNFEKILVNPNSGLYFSKKKVKLGFKSSPEDVISILGSPNRTFCKEEEKVRINSIEYMGPLGPSDYFYNYFDLGLDILFDVNTHKALKFILHTNFPSDIDFNLYSKCNFELGFQIREGNINSLKGLKKEEESQSDISDIDLHDSDEEDDEILTPQSTWDSIKKFLGNEVQPSNIGASKFFGLRNLIIQMSEKRTILSITIFNPSN